MKVRSITVIARKVNTSSVWIGGDDIATASYEGTVPGEGYEVPTGQWLDVKDWFVLTAVNGEGVDWFAVKA